MLFPLSNENRQVQSLQGIWRFRFDPQPGREGAGFDAGFFQSPLEDTVSLAVPSSWNDLFEDQKDRDFVGWVWYEQEFTVGPQDPKSVRVLRFGSATHQAKVYINGRFVTEHVGGFTPFEAEVDEFLLPGTNRTTFIGIFVAMAGFREAFPTIDTPSSPTLFWLGMFFFIGMPILGWLASLIAMQFYDLTGDKMAEVQQVVHEREHVVASAKI